MNTVQNFEIFAPKLMRKENYSVPGTAPVRVVERS